MKKLIIISMMLLLSSLPLYADDDPTFCNNPQAWDHINTMVEKDPNDIPLLILHALKIGLCVKLEQNSINSPEAINLFNDMVDSMANKRDEEEVREGAEHL
jgi:hypothetical protein